MDVRQVNSGHELVNKLHWMQNDALICSRRRLTMLLSQTLCVYWALFSKSSFLLISLLPISSLRKLQTLLISHSYSDSWGTCRSSREKTNLADKQLSPRAIPFSASPALVPRAVLSPYTVPINSWFSWHTSLCDDLSLKTAVTTPSDQNAKICKEL